MSRARDFADLAGSADAGGITGRNLIINGGYTFLMVTMVLLPLHKTLLFPVVKVFTTALNSIAPPLMGLLLLVNIYHSIIG
jgi:hypothetical protein